ncbi:MAG: hypothetical protein ABIE94_02255 [archaeon]
MYPLSHFLLPFFIGEIFVEFGSFNHWMALFAALIGTFIDIDHLIEYIVRHKEVSVLHAWNAAVVKHESERSFIHHQLGYFLVTGIVIILFFTDIIVFGIVAIGYYSHMLLDAPDPFKMKKVKFITLKEAGFVVKLPRYELILDILLAVGIVLLFVF